MSSVEEGSDGTSAEMYHRYLQSVAREATRHRNLYMDIEASFSEGPVMEANPPQSSTAGDTLTNTDTPSPTKGTITQDIQSPMGDATTLDSSSLALFGNSIASANHVAGSSPILFGLGTRDHTRTAEQNDSSIRAWMITVASALYMFLSQGTYRSAI